MFKRSLSAATVLIGLLAVAGCGQSMSAKQVAAYFERSTNGGMQNVVCTTRNTNGWKYSCSFTNPDTGARMKVGASIAGNAPGGPAPYGTGAVPINEPLPPRHS